MGGVQLGWGGVGKLGDECLLSKLSPTFSVTGEAVTTEAGSSFQYFTTLTENAHPLLRRWLAPLSTL